MMATAALGFAPLVPWWLIALLGIPAGAGALYGLARWVPGSGLRLFVVSLLILVLANPRLENEKRQAKPDIAVVMLDNSSSQKAGRRPEQMVSATAEIKKKLARFEDLETIFLDTDENEDGTQAFAELNRALADIPAGRFAGALILTDGQIHDAPAPGARGAPSPAFSAQAEKFSGAPLHVLLTGAPEERDRRLVVEQAPAFGIVGKSIGLRLRIHDAPGPAGGSARLSVKLADGAARSVSMPVGRSKVIRVPIDHGGATIIQLEAEALPGEMSLINNNALVTVNGVRDRLRVLLISGQPHAGERIWRNLLKSDPSVDLVHFTILRPPDKNDFTPLNELALIAFPIRELFEIKLHEFDLVIFDRYVIRFLLPPAYFRNIENYVRRGGAILATVGPAFAGERSLFHTPLGEVLPGAPNGRVMEGGFRARLTDKGKRHPVTASLIRGGSGSPAWGRWFRQIEAQARRGQVLMNGDGDKPLLILDRVEKGRVAQFLSDHIWLWARGFEGGGPHAELLRRLSHWLMKEPDLEEEDLRAKVRGRQMSIERRTLSEDNPPVTIRAPSGAEQVVRLKPGAGGRARAEVEAKEKGLYRLRDGARQALAVVGRPNAPELMDLRASPERLQPLAKATGGSVSWISQGVVDFRRVKPGRGAHGHQWAGLVRNGAYVVTGVSQVSLLGPLLLLLLGGGGLMLAWWREGR